MDWAYLPDVFAPPHQYRHRHDIEEETVAMATESHGRNGPPDPQHPDQPLDPFVDRLKPRPAWRLTEGPQPRSTIASYLVNGSSRRFVQADNSALVLISEGLENS